MNYKLKLTSIGAALLIVGLLAMPHTKATAQSQIRPRTACAILTINRTWGNDGFISGVFIENATLSSNLPAIPPRANAAQVIADYEAMGLQHRGMKILSEDHFQIILSGQIN